MRKGQKHGRVATSVELGIHGERVSPGDHIALLWEKPQEFEAAVGFLELALLGREHGVLFGHREANERVVQILRSRGHDVEALERQGKLTILNGVPDGDALLASVGATFQRAVDNGATLIRLLGNIGWGRERWPIEEDRSGEGVSVRGALPV
jgi:hypothetical protein